MTRKADFNAEEWSTLVEAPVLAGMRVVTAGRGGTLRESMAKAYRSFVVKLAETVASAHKEGGFLGVGGTEISDDERRALDEIAATLGASTGSP